MKYFKDKYDILLYNWLMITENGFNLKYLLKKETKLTPKRQKILYQTYIKILDSLKGMEYRVLLSYIKWQASFIDFKTELLKNNSAKIQKKEYQIVNKNLETDFREYLEELQKNYKQFEVKEFYFDDNYKDIYKNLTKEESPKELDKFKGIRFYDYAEYNIFLQKNPELIILGYIPEFNKLFIKERIIKIDELIKLDTYMSDIFTENGKYNEYQEVRRRLFELNNLSSERKKEMSGFDDVSVTSKILGFNIDTKKTTLAEFESHLKTAKRAIEENKPKPAGKTI